MLPSDASRLDIALVRGIAWVGGVKWSVQFLQWGTTIVVARILTPADYGLFGMAMVFVGLMGLLNEFGIGAAIVTMRELDDEQVAQVNGLALLFGACCFGMSLLAAIPLAAFFGVPQLRAVVGVLSAGFLLRAFETVPFALLQRDLQFRLIAIFEATGAVVVSLGILVSALLGLHHWALVLGFLLSTGIRSSLFVSRRAHRFAWPRFATLRNTIHFSRDLMVARLSWYVYSNSDALVVGRVLGQTALGAYQFASVLANLPVERVTALVTGVTPSLFSAVQQDSAAMRRYLLNLTAGLSLITFPVAWGLAIVSEEVILLVLGEKWQPAVVPLAILSAYAAVRSIEPMFSQILAIKRETRFGMWISLRSAVLLPLAFLIGSQWGTAGVAATWIVAHPLCLSPLYARVFRLIGLSIVDYGKALWPALSASLVMSVATLTLKLTLPSTASLWGRLAIEVLGGGAAYVLVLLVFHRRRLDDFLRLRRMLRPGKA
jgi:PST family polysaccharide transporter